MKKIGVFSLVLFSFQIFAQTGNKKPHLFIDNTKSAVTEGMYVNCLKIKDLTAFVFMNEAMQSYDKIVIELHRFGTDADIIAASKTINPSSKEFLKKYMKQDSVKINVLAEETQFSRSDLDANTTLFPASSTPNSVFCKSHDLKQCNFYIIVKGYKKTGEKTQFNEDVFDKGIDLSLKSAVFKSWEDKTVR